MSGFRDLIVWQEASRLEAAVNAVADEIRALGYVASAEQISSAGESIPSNIAEGYGRGVNADCLRFQRIARSSCDELESRIVGARNSRRISPATAESLIDHITRVRYLIGRFAASVERRRTA